MIRRIAGALVAALSLLFIYNALRLFTFNPLVLGKYFPFKWIIFGHIVGGMVALLAGPFQLSKRFRSRYRRAHRVMGRGYVIGTTVGSLCALVLATKTAPPVGWAYALSLHMLAIVWLACGVAAWRTAVHRRLREHEEWATRSYIATVAFVAQSLSFALPWTARLGTLAEVAPTVIWLSWTVPMFVYDLARPRDRRPSVATARAT